MQDAHEHVACVNRTFYQWIIPEGLSGGQQHSLFIDRTHPDGGEQAVFGFPACDRRGQIPYRIPA